MTIAQSIKQGAARYAASALIAAGLIAGDALLSFFSSIIPGLRHK